MYIAVCGPSGAGKDTVAELIASHFGYVHVSGGDILRDMLISLGMEPKKTALGPFGEFIRAQYGLEPLFQRVLQKAEGHAGVVISGIRSPDEARLVQHYGGKVIYIDAPQSVRYKRIIGRARTADIATYDAFLALEADERAGSSGTQQNLTHIRQIANRIVDNSGTKAELTRRVKRLEL